MRSGLGRVLLMFLGVAISIIGSIIFSHAQSVNYYYDNLNRLIRIDYGDTVIDYTYDDVGNRETERIGHPPITTATPAGGTYGSAQTAYLNCTDPQGPGCGNIYYTLDGSPPTTSSSIYSPSSPIQISATTTLKFFAEDQSTPQPIYETVKTHTYVIDTVPPTGSIVVQGGAESTTSPNVTLTLTCSDSAGCSQMQFSNDNITYSTPQANGASTAWTLEACDGVKNVYVKFKDTFGNWSNRFWDTIVLNNNPANPPVIVGGSNYTTLQDAYNAAAEGATIKTQARRFIESLTVNQNKNVTLEGGYDPTFTTNSGAQTNVKGMITTTAGGGRITIKNFVIEK